MDPSLESTLPDPPTPSSPHRKDACDERHPSDASRSSAAPSCSRSRVAAAAGAHPAGLAKKAARSSIGLTAGEPDALDPTLARTFSGREVFLTFCEKLYDLNSKAQIVPQLASALPTISKDKLTVTIPLRKGIKFNDGTPFNADAVVKTLQRDQTLKGSARASEISPVDTRHRERRRTPSSSISRRRTRR